VALPPRRLIVAVCAVALVGTGVAAAMHRSPDMLALSAATARAIPDPSGGGRPASGPTQPTTTAPTEAGPTPASAGAIPTTPAPVTKAPTTSQPSSGPTTTKTTTKAPTPRPPNPTTKPPTQTPSSIVDQVLAHINTARAQNGLTALTLSTNLSRASELHNQLMINGCGLSHQCPGEAGLGARFTAQGVQWTSAGENIGFGSAGSSTAAIVGAANGLTDSMLAEVPPNDGHRRNLLNPGFRHIGLAIERDAKGLVWMTQDFVN